MAAETIRVVERATTDAVTNGSKQDKVGNVLTWHNKIYDATTAAMIDSSGASFTGKIGGDVLTVAAGSASFADKNVGTGKTVGIIGLTLGGADAGNYSLASTTTSTTADITPASITVRSSTMKRNVWLSPASFSS